MNAKRDLLTIGDVADELDCSRKTIYNLMNQSDFPRPIKIGKRTVRWKRQEIEDWVDAQPRTEKQDG